MSPTEFVCSNALAATTDILFAAGLLLIIIALSRTVCELTFLWKSMRAELWRLREAREGNMEPAE